jgi:hypothetical protein
LKLQVREWVLEVLLQILLRGYLGVGKNSQGSSVTEILLTNYFTKVFKGYVKPPFPSFAFLCENYITS